MNRLDQDLEILDRRFGQNAVTEVEDVARLSAGAAQHFTRAFADQVRWAEQHRWVEIALNPAREADSAPSVLQSYAPVQGHYVRTGLRECGARRALRSPRAPARRPMSRTVGSPGRRQRPGP